MKITKLTPKQDVLWRIYLTFALMGFIGILIMGRIASIQYFEGSQLREKAEQEHIALKDVKAPRGNILADDGSLLATSLPYFKVHWDTKVVPRDTFDKYVDTLATCLATYVYTDKTPGLCRQELINARDSSRRYHPILPNVSYILLQKIKEFPIFSMGDRLKSGLIVEQMAKRQYPFKMLAHRTIGYSRVVQTANGPDTLSVGLERSFDDVLAGEQGKQYMQRLSKDLWVPVDDISKIEPRAGQDIVTTIDVNIQDVTERALLESLQQYEGEHGCAIVMDVKTGAIKAIANIGFNKERTEFWENYNYAVGERTEPGSTFKLASIMALMEDGYVKPTDTVNLNEGRWQFYDETMEDASYHGLRLTTVGKAFEISSNVGIAKLTHKYYNKSKEGQSQFIQRLSDMVLTQSTNVDIDGEREPYIKDPNNSDWSGITIPWMSIGYESELTPLQMLTFYSAVANGGQMMKPQIVTEIRSYGSVVKKIPPKVVKRRIASEATIQAATDMLKRVVASPKGTAHSIYTPRYDIAGKTGTAIMNYKAHKQKGEAKRYRGSFAGFFPADNPAYACVVVITNPRTGFYGGRVAAPVFRKIADYCYSLSLGSHKALNADEAVYTDATLPRLPVGQKEDLNYIMKELNLPFADSSATPWAVGMIRNDSINLRSRNVQKDVVPNVVGMGLKDALFLLENNRLRVRVLGVGKVKSQSVPAGRSIQSVQTITLVLG
ncbi:penicillin-binding protein [Saprospira grandis]|uniref:penicillin-binding protein n=1 Tax=Saprospira grandis TaxID=1008 RepID=UPI0022DD33D5|nr:penicillin-binding protein [Saprospira grandis]WBM75251.1 transpeptidase family protein [Saprospira grandis]